MVLVVHLSKTTGDATNATTLAVDISQFNVDSHTLTKSEIPEHKHTVNHGHNSVTIDTFNGNNGNINVNVSGDWHARTHYQ